MIQKAAKGLHMLHTNKRADIAHKNFERTLQLNAKYRTNFNIIQSNKPSRLNTSGVKGVSYNNRSGMFVAYINVQGKRRYLGSYWSLEAAAKAREEAVNKYFAPLIAAKNREHGG